MTISIIDIFTAAAAFITAYISGNFLLPPLRRLRFISDGRETTGSRNVIPSGGGIMLAAGIYIPAALGYIALRFFTDSIGSGGNDDLMYFAGQISMFAAFAAGFYADLLECRGKKDGFSVGGEILCGILPAAVFTVIRFRCFPSETGINIPFLGKISFGYGFFPLMFGIMILISECVSASDNEGGSLPAGLAVFTAGAVTLFSDIPMNSFGVLSAAAAGSGAALLVKNFPDTKVSAGRSGTMLAGMTAAVLTVSAGGAEICMAVMLIPFFVDNIIHLLRKNKILKSKTKIFGKTAAAEKTAARFAFGAVCSFSGLALYYIIRG